jgi:hypothetical protein
LLSSENGEVPIVAMTNISQEEPHDSNQLPYSGPVLTKSRPRGGGKPSFPIIVPAQSSWFDLASVHQIEMRGWHITHSLA